MYTLCNYNEIMRPDLEITTSGIISMIIFLY